MPQQDGNAPNGSDIVRTVLGDVAPAQLAWTLTHEHLVARLPAWVEDRDLFLGDEAAAERELRSFREAGGTALIEMSTLDYGRDPAALVRLAEASGVQLIAATGFNTRRFSGAWVARCSEQELAVWMTEEVRSGMLPFSASPTDSWALATGGQQRSPARAGVIKVATGGDRPNDVERTAMRAALAAHAATGAPVSTHTERGAWAPQQAATLRDGGVAGTDLLIGHLDFRPEVAYLKEVAATGAFLGFDQFSKRKYLSDEDRVRLVARLASEGFLDQILLSSDLARQSYWPAYGHADAPGLVHIAASVVPLLRVEGFGDPELTRVLRDNPSRLLRFAPRGEADEPMSTRTAEPAARQEGSAKR